MLFLLALVPGAIVGTFYLGVAGMREYLAADLATLVAILLFAIAPHAEYTRLLAAYGAFGAIMIVLMVVISVRIVWQSDGWYRMDAAGLIVMSLTRLLTNASRMGSIGIAFGFASVLEDAA